MSPPQTQALAAFPSVDQAARAQLSRAISASRRLLGIRGDRIIDRYDAARGSAIADRARDGVAQQIAVAHAGTIEAFCERVKAVVPSAKPCRLSYPEGMRDSHVRTELRAGHLAGWHWARLCSVADAMDCDVEVVLKPRSRG